MVYRADCLECKLLGKTNCYVGETGRKLDDRIREHMRAINSKDLNNETISAVALHSFSEHGKQPAINDWDFKILDKSEKTQDRRCLEGY